MAELKSTTAIGGNIVWHGGNLRFDPQGDSVLYDGYKVYTELDKPDPHTDLTESVVKRAGDSMSGSLHLNKTGLALSIDGGVSDGSGDTLGGVDAWIRMGNSSYAWNLTYVGSTSAAGGNEFMIQSTSSNKAWRFDHDGNFEYYNGSNYSPVLHTGNYTTYLDSRYAELSGDTFTGPVIFSGGDVKLYDSSTSYSHELQFQNSAYIAGLDYSISKLFRFIDRTEAVSRIEFNLGNGAGRFYGEVSSDVSLVAPKVYIGDKGNGYFYSDSDGRTAFTGGNFYIQSGVPTTYIYSDTIYIGDGDDSSLVSFRGNQVSGDNWMFTTAGDLDMQGTDIIFDTGHGIEGASASYNLKFNSTSIDMESVGDITIEADSNDNETTRYLNLIAGLNTLRVRGGANDLNSVEFNGHDLIHMGNYTSKLDSRYVNATGDSMTGNLTMNTSMIIGTSTGYFLNLMGGNSSPTLQSNASVIIQADLDGTGATEGIELRAGAGSKNTLRIDSTTSASSADAVTYNGSTMQHDGRSEMNFDDGAATIEYNSTSKSIDFIFA